MMMPSPPSRSSAAGAGLLPQQPQRQRLYSEGVMFNAVLAPLSDYKGKMTALYDINDHDPLVNRTGNSVLVNNSPTTMGHRDNPWQCMVSSGINDVYRYVRHRLREDAKAHYDFETGEPIDETKWTRGMKGLWMAKARILMLKECHFVGFARGSAKFGESQVAVNCGGNVTIKADESIASGEYVAVDFDTDLLFLREETFLQRVGAAKCLLKVRSFAQCSKEAIQAALYLGKAVDEIRSVLGRGAAQVIGQCKSGCHIMSNMMMIDVKLDVKINKRSYVLLGMPEAVTNGSLRALRACLDPLIMFAEVKEGFDNLKLVTTNAHTYLDSKDYTDVVEAVQRIYKQLKDSVLTMSRDEILAILVECKDKLSRATQHQIHLNDLEDRINKAISEEQTKGVIEMLKEALDLKAPYFLDAFHQYTRVVQIEARIGNWYWRRRALKDMFRSFLNAPYFHDVNQVIYIGLQYGLSTVSGVQKEFFDEVFKDSKLDIITVIENYNKRNPHPALPDMIERIKEAT